MVPEKLRNSIRVFLFRCSVPPLAARRSNRPLGNSLKYNGVFFLADLIKGSQVLHPACYQLQNSLDLLCFRQSESDILSGSCQLASTLLATSLSFVSYFISLSRLFKQACVHSVRCWKVRTFS